MYLSVTAPKILMLAGTDRLDKPLTIGQMQGKFQMSLLPQVHACFGALQQRPLNIKTVSISASVCRLGMLCMKMRQTRQQRCCFILFKGLKLVSPRFQLPLHRCSQLPGWGQPSVCQDCLPSQIVQCLTSDSELYPALPHLAASSLPSSWPSTFFSHSGVFCFPDLVMPGINCKVHNNQRCGPRQETPELCTWCCCSL